MLDVFLDILGLNMAWFEALDTGYQIAFTLIIFVFIFYMVSMLLFFLVKFFRLIGGGGV